MLVEGGLRRGRASLGSRRSKWGGFPMRRLSVVLAATCLSLAAPALAGPTEDFHALMDEYWATSSRMRLCSRPRRVSRTYDRELGVVSLAEYDRQTAEAAAFLARLKAIAPAQLSRGRPDQLPDPPAQPVGCRRSQSLRRAADAVLVARQLPPVLGRDRRAAAVRQLRRL